MQNLCFKLFRRDETHALELVYHDNSKDTCTPNLNMSKKSHLRVVINVPVDLCF